MLAVLIQNLDHPDMHIRNQAKVQLLRLGTEAVEPLIAALHSHSARISWHAAQILSNIDDPRWIEPMHDLLKTGTIVLAQTAVYALEEALGDQAFDYFIDALFHVDPIVQTNLIQALERMNNRQAIDPLIHILETTTNTQVRYCAIQALGKLGDPQVIPLIKLFENDENHHVRERVVIALARLEG